MEEQVQAAPEMQAKPSSSKLSKKTIKIVIGILVLVAGVIAGVTYAVLQDNDNKIDDQNESEDTNNKEAVDDTSTKVFTSGKGSFSITLPSNQGIVMTELAEIQEGGFTKGEVVFTFGAYEEAVDGDVTQPQFSVSYSKPSIDGKGGYCDPQFTEEVIASQDVSVCESDTSFSASYFKNPTREIEYAIQTINVTAAQKEILANAVRNTLKFN